MRFTLPVARALQEQIGSRGWDCADPLLRSGSALLTLVLALGPTVPAQSAALAAVGANRPLSVTHTTDGKHTLSATGFDIEELLEPSVTFYRTLALMNQADVQIARPSRAEPDLDLIWKRIQEGRTESDDGRLLRLATEYRNDLQSTADIVYRLSIQKLENNVVGQARGAEPSGRLVSYPDYIALLASIHRVRGEYAQGIQVVHAGLTRMQSQGLPATPTLEIQQCQLLFAVEPDSRDLYESLKRLAARSPLTEAQSNDYRELWTLWSIGQAEKQLARGEFSQAAAALIHAWEKSPKEPRIRSALAWAYLEAADPARALKVFDTLETNVMRGPADVVGAALAAMQAMDGEAAERWVSEGLSRWPTNPSVRLIAGRHAALVGDYDNAALHWQASMETLGGIVRSPDRHTAIATLGGAPPPSDPPHSDRVIRAYGLQHEPLVFQLGPTRR